MKKEFNHLRLRFSTDYCPIKNRVFCADLCAFTFGKQTQPFSIKKLSKEVYGGIDKFNLLYQAKHPGLRPQNALSQIDVPSEKQELGIRLSLRPHSSRAKIHCLELQKTTEINHYGCFSLGPFPIGTGLNIANTLRRVLLLDLSGVSIISVEFPFENAPCSPDGRLLSGKQEVVLGGAQNDLDLTQVGSKNDVVEALEQQKILNSAMATTMPKTSRKPVKIHELSIIPGLRESILELLFNIEKVRFKNVFPFLKPQKGRFLRSTKGKFFARDLELPIGIELMNPDQYLGEILTDTLELAFLVQIAKSTGSAQGMEFLTDRHSLTSRCVFPIQSTFSPISKVNFRIEENPNTFANIKASSFRSINLNPLKEERIIFEIWTDGTIHPLKALIIGLQLSITKFYEFLSTVICLPSRSKIQGRTRMALRPIKKSLKWNPHTAHTPGSRGLQRKPRLRTAQGNILPYKFQRPSEIGGQIFLRFRKQIHHIVCWDQLTPYEKLFLSNKLKHFFLHCPSKSFANPSSILRAIKSLALNVLS